MTTRTTGATTARTAPSATLTPWSYDTLEECEEALGDARLQQLSDGL